MISRGKEKAIALLQGIGVDNCQFDVSVISKVGKDVVEKKIERKKKKKEMKRKYRKK